jgi:hypothetical protein
MLPQHAESLVLTARADGRDLKTSEEFHAYLDEKLARIDTARALLADAFPAAPLVKRAAYPFETRPELRLAILQLVVNGVIHTIDQVKVALVTGDLDVFDADVLVQRVRDELGIEQNEHRKGVLDEAMQMHRHATLVRSMGLAVAAVALLFIPGIGPFLSAGLGIATAAISVERAIDVSRGAAAGLHGGIVGEREAASAVFWAAIDVLVAGLDVAGAVKALAAAKVAPHVAASSERAVARAANVTGRTVEQVLPRAAEAAGQQGAAFAMRAEDLHELVTRLFRRPAAPMTGQVHFYANEAEYAAAWANTWKRLTGKAPTGKPPAGFFHPDVGIHVAPGRGLQTALHEAVHKVAHETFPLGDMLLGEFLDEGITEALAQGVAGPAPGRVYPRNLEFVKDLKRFVGNDAVNFAVLHGDYRGLREAVKRALGGSEQETFLFFSMLRRVGANPTAADERLLKEAMDMLRGRAKAAAAAEVHGLGATPGVKGPSAQEVEDVTFATREEYLKALRPVFPGQALDSAVAIVDEIGAKAAEEVVKDPRFLQAVKSKNWTLAGTLFHSAAKRQGEALTKALKGFKFEFVLKSGAGGSRLDILIEDALGLLIEVDWKTTGRSAISYSARKEMAKHAAQAATELGAPVSTQLSKSWVDFVRPHLGGVTWPREGFGSSQQVIDLLDEWAKSM